MRWSGDGRTAFDDAWSQFSGHGAEASEHAQEMGDHLFKLGDQIKDAQHEWELAMTAMTASTAIGVGLTFVTFGMSDAVAEGAATAAVGTMEAVCAALDMSLNVALRVLMAAVRVAAQLVVKFSWQFGITLVSQETAKTVDGRSLSNEDLLQAIAVPMLIPEGGELVSPVAGLSRMGSALKRDLPKNVLGTVRVETEGELTQLPLAHAFRISSTTMLGWDRSSYSLPAPCSTRCRALWREWRAGSNGSSTGVWSPIGCSSRVASSTECPYNRESIGRASGARYAGHVDDDRHGPRRPWVCISSD